jgi:CO dehydrogenase nickel-insertion accessory protein CooC1
VTREPEIALVLSAEAWVDALHRHCADHGGARVRCLVLDPVVALDEEFDVLVASERWPALTRPFVDALHQRGRLVLAVGDPAAGDDLARRLGVDRHVAGASPPEMVETVLALVAGRPSGPVGAAGGAGGLPAPATEWWPAAPTGPTDDPPRLVAVGGPWGAGSTETALTLAARCVRSGARPVVVDADTVTPSVAVRLGLPLEPNLCTAVDAVAFGLGAVPGALFDLGDDWPVVLVGVPNRRVRAAVSGADVVAVGDVLAQRFAPVIVDVSAGAASPGDAIDDVRSRVIERSRVVIAVGVANPVGVVRLAEWIDDVRGVAPAVPVHVVVNRAPTSRARRAEIARELQGGTRIAGLTFVPTDPRVDDAVWEASLVERGPFARAVETVRRATLADLEPDRSRIGVA